MNKTTIKAIGSMIPPLQPKELSPARQPGEYVFWSNGGKSYNHGTLMEWDGTVAIIDVEGKIVRI